MNPERQPGDLYWSLAGILEVAMRFFGPVYPREQAERQARLARVRGRTRAEWDPFYQLDERFFAWLKAEGNRWERAADAYAATVAAG